MAQIQWFPLYALFILRLVKTPRLRTALLVGVFWVLSLSVYTTYIGYFGILFPVAFFAYHIVEAARAHELLEKAAVSGKIVLICNP